MCNILPLCTICYKNKQNLWLHLLRNRAIINAMQLYMIRIFLVFSHVLRKRSGKFAERKGEHYENWSNRTQLYPRCRFCDELSEGTGLLSVSFGKIPCTIFVEREKVAFGKEYDSLFHPGVFVNSLYRKNFRRQNIVRICRKNCTILLFEKTC